MNTEKVLSIVLALAFIVPTIIGMCMNASVVTPTDLGLQRTNIVDGTIVESNSNNPVPVVDSSRLDDAIQSVPYVDSPLVIPDEIRNKFWQFIDGDFEHSSIPINYLNGNEWTNINTTVVPRDNKTFGGEYVAACNQNIFSVMFKNNTAFDNYVTISTPIEIGGINYTSSVDMNYERAYYYNKSTESIEYISNGSGDLAVQYGNIASYNVYQNITERYVTSSDGLKHYYIVDSINKTNPVWWGTNVDLIIPFTVEYNTMEFELQYDNHTITGNCEVQNVSVVNKISGERVYFIDSIRVFDNETSLDVGHYFIDYTPGSVTISTNISISDIYDLNDKFVIDPVWVIEYTATGRVDGSYDNYDWSDDLGTDIGTPMMQYVDKRVGTSYATPPRYTNYVELPRQSDADYSYCMDNFNYLKNPYSPIVVGMDGGWSRIYSETYPNSQFYGNVTSVPSVYGKAVQFSHIGGPFRSEATYDFTRSVGINSRNINMSIDFNHTQPLYDSGSKVYGGVSYELIMDGAVSAAPGVYIGNSYDPDNPSSTMTNFYSVTIYTYQSPSGAGATYATYNLSLDCWYTLQFYNFTYSDNTDNRGYRFITYNVNVYNITGDVDLCDEACVIDYFVSGYPYIQETYGATGFKITYSAYSTNMSRTSSFTFDDLRVYKDDVYENSAYVVTKGTEDMITPSDYGMIYKYDIFVLYLEYNQYYRDNDYDSVVYVQYKNSTDDWDWIPDTDLPGNEDGFSIMDVSNTHFFEGYEENNHYSGVIIVDLSKLDASQIGDGTYKNIRFVFFTTVPTAKDYGIFVKDWKLWYVNGYVSSAYVYESMYIDTISGVYPMTVTYYPTEYDSNIKFNLIHSLFGDTEPMAGSRIYYMENPSQPSIDNVGWIQIESLLFEYNIVESQWEPIASDYDFIHTDTYRNGVGGAINWNMFNWYPETSVPEGDDYWFKVETLNGGFTVMNVQITTDPVSVVYNQAPVVILGDNITVTGIEPISIDVLELGSYDDGGDDNIISYQYIITGVDYNRYIYMEESGLSFILPDDGIYFLSVYISDSKDVGTSGTIQITNLNAQPTLYIRKYSVSSTDEALPIEMLAVGDIAKIDLRESFDEDGYIVSYSVDFGDNVIDTYNSLGANIYPTIEHTYVKAGTYIANVTSIDDDADTSYVRIMFIITDEISVGYAGERVQVLVDSTGIPIVTKINEVKAGTRYDWLAKYMYKDTVSLVIEKNELFTDSLADREDDNITTLSEDSLDIVINTNYMGENSVWKQGKVFGSDILVYSVTDDVVTLVSRDVESDILGTYTDGNVALSVDGNFDQIVVVVNPSLWFKVKTVMGSRNIVEFVDINSATIAMVRDIEDLGFGDLQ